MPRVDCVVETTIERTGRAALIEGLFDVPKQTTQRLEWHGDVPLDERAWNVGLIVGPSGAGKSTVARSLFKEVERPLSWSQRAVVDDFPRSMGVEQIAGICQSVGFNTIPAWLRPYHALSNGEQFRVGLARRLAESDGLVVVDEFTSVVDRQVAQIGCHAVQKYVRASGGKFVAVTCHEDVEPWLRPDWVLRLPQFEFAWRCLQRRPSIECEIRRVPRATWGLFAPYHYMTATLHRGAQCFGLFVGGRIASFVGCLYRPHPTTRNLMGVSRVVTLPDFQGLGLAFVLVDALGAAYKAVGQRYRNYPAHPSFVRACARSQAWRCVKRPGRHSSRSRSMKCRVGGRPCAVFEYCGPAMADTAAAQRLLKGV